MKGKLPAGIMPDPRAQLPDLLLRNEGMWVRHEGLRPGVYRHLSSSGDECVTVRIQLPPNGLLSSDSFRRLADLVDRHAQVGRRTSRNAFELVGVDPERLEELIEQLAALGYPVGGTGNSLHQIKSCGGFVACQNAAIDSPALAKALGDRFFDDAVTQRYPAWLKLSIGGCPNQCGGGVEADVGLLGVFKGLPQVDDARLVESQCDVPLLCFWCPTGAIKPKAVRGGMSVEINPERCTRCTILLVRDDGRQELQGRHHLRVGPARQILLVPVAFPGTEESAQVGQGGSQPLQQAGGRLPNLPAPGLFSLYHVRPPLLPAVRPRCCSAAATKLSAQPGAARA